MAGSSASYIIREYGITKQSQSTSMQCSGVGQEIDGHFHYFAARWYSAAVGRFVSRSWFASVFEHAYAYVESSPVIWVDPTGRQYWEPQPDYYACMDRVKNEVTAELPSPPQGSLRPRPWDKAWHCRTLCRIVRECTSKAWPGAWLAGTAREIPSWWRGDDSWAGIDADLQANAIGRKCGRKCKNVTCRECCDHNGLTAFGWYRSYTNYTGERYIVVGDFIQGGGGFGSNPDYAYVPAGPGPGGKFCCPP